MCINSSWVAVGVPTVTSLPGSPANGDEVYYQFYLNGTSGNTGYWHLRYNSSTTYWDFLGGPAIYTEVTAVNTTTSTTYAALGTAGPTATLPLAGDYSIGIGAEIGYAGSGNGCMSYDIGATPAVDADAACMAAPTGVGGGISRTVRKTGLTAVTLTTKYRQLNNVAPNMPSFAKRWIQITPSRVQ